MNRLDPVLQHNAGGVCQPWRVASVPWGRETGETELFHAGMEMFVPFEWKIFPTTNRKWGVNPFYMMRIKLAQTLKTRN